MRPSWLKTKLPSGEISRDVAALLARLNLHTVCAAARCPNLGDCWGRGTATFMILGDVCTRHCKFCAVRTGNPGEGPDETEPDRIAEAVAKLKLKYVVVTSVDRDDLPDLGAGQFAASVRAIKPLAQVEVLIPDFGARRNLLESVLEAGPEVLGHNLETVEALTPQVRDQRSSYRRSLEVLRVAKELNPQQTTKSGIMVGLGETTEQVQQTLRDLRDAETDIVTIGQYLQPTRRNLPAKEYVALEQFAAYERDGRELGFRAVLAGPLVRSSFHAEGVAQRLTLDASRLAPGTPAGRS
jgi:lipoic acid synthetase